VRQLRKHYATFRSNNNLPGYTMFALSILDQNRQLDLVLDIIEKLRLLGDNPVLSRSQWYVCAEWNTAMT
jgi:hypothetical protein